MVVLYKPQWMLILGFGFRMTAQCESTSKKKYKDRNQMAMMQQSSAIPREDTRMEMKNSRS